jgi:hypothetical protein
MVDCNTLTESSFRTLLQDEAKKFVTAPLVIITGRRAYPNGITRSVTATVIVAINNDELLDALIKLSLNYDFNFTGSETNLQGEMEVDYLFFTADIIANLGD